MKRGRKFQFRRDTDHAIKGVDDAVLLSFGTHADNRYLLDDKFKDVKILKRMFNDRHVQIKAWSSNRSLRGALTLSMDHVKL